MAVVGPDGTADLRSRAADEPIFSPLRGFMTRSDYDGVCHNMRFGSGVLWPMPITLDVTEEFAKTLKPGSSKVALRDPEGVMLAVLHVEEVWQPDRKAEAQAVFSTTSTAHPGVDYLLTKSHPGMWVGGSRESSQPRITTSRRCVSLPRNFAPSLRVWAGGG